MNSPNRTPIGTGKATLGYSNERKQQLSSGLKERLKRCGRYHCTPPSAKRPCLSAQRELSAHELSESPIGKGNETFNTKCETSSVNGDNTTPKPLKSCSRKVNTSLSFQSPVLKPVISNCEESPSSSHSASAPPLPDVSEAGTPLSSKLSQCGRRVFVRNKSKLFDAGSGKISGGEDEVIHLKKELKDLKSCLAVKEEKLRKLKMVKMYRSKNNLDELQKLIDKWRSVSQEAITDLHQLLPEPRPSLAEFVKHLQVDTQLVQIQLEED